LGVVMSVRFAYYQLHSLFLNLSSLYPPLPAYLLWDSSHYSLS
jgi:hypothetical protein